MCTYIFCICNVSQVKCHQYWPSHGHVAYGNHQVTLQAVECLSDCTIRVFTVEMVISS